MSNFQNPSGNTALGKESAEDKEADKYTGTIYWEYNRVYPSGNYSPKKQGWDDSEFTTIKTRHAVAVDLLDANQSMIGEPKISAGAQRFFEDEDVMGWKTIPVGEVNFAIPVPPRVWTVVKKKRVVSQTESDEHKKTD